MPHPGPARMAVYKPLWHISLLSVQSINSWRWTDKLSETWKISWQNKFVKLVHLFGFIMKKFSVGLTVLRAYSRTCRLLNDGLKLKYLLNHIRNKLKYSLSLCHVKIMFVYLFNIRRCKNKAPNCIE